MATTAAPVPGGEAEDPIQLDATVPEAEEEEGFSSSSEHVAAGAVENEAHQEKRRKLRASKEQQHQDEIKFVAREAASEAAKEAVAAALGGAKNTLIEEFQRQLHITTDEFDKHRNEVTAQLQAQHEDCLLYTSPSPRDATLSRMPSSA